MAQHLKAGAERFRRQHNANALLAWNIFTLEHGKGLKTLRGLQIQPNEKRPQSAADHLVIVQKWMAGRKAR